MNLSLHPHWRQIAIAVVTVASAAIAPAQTETILHVFQAGSDGYFPEIYPVVLDGAGNLYGTTNYGGGGNCMVNVYAGCGMIYQLARPANAGAWTENIIWQFQGGSDGGYPGGLLARNGRLYGVAATGGSGACTGGCGYLFELVPPAAVHGAWTKKSVYDFPASATACAITAAAADGFYGVGGSPSGNGTVCKLTAPGAAGSSWTVRSLYAFKGVPRNQKIGDGSGPISVSLDAQGNLWGTTIDGGSCQRFEGGVCFGIIFELTPPSASAGAWTEKVAYRFTERDENPISGVVFDRSGALYGVTYVEAYRFAGTTFTVIDGFTDTVGNARAPTGGVAVDSAGNVYGTTGAGGQFDDGTVYKVTPPATAGGVWTQTVLHSFAGGTDGWNPEGPVILGAGGVLFGTTQIGGNQGCQLGFGGTGCGTVFAVVP